MTDQHHHYADWPAAYVLGALDADDRRAFESHLAACDLCTAEVAEFAALPGLLAQVEAADLEHTADPARAARIDDSARQEVTALRRHARMWRLAAMASAAAAMILAIVLVSPGPHGPAEPVPQSASVVSSVASSAEVSVSARAWGTEITLAITGLPTRESYQLWAVGTDGEWTNAATWSPTPTGVVRLTGASRTPTDRLDRILITSTDISDVLLDASL
jgi:anti-sigma factor RsiW